MIKMETKMRMMNPKNHFSAAARLGGSLHISYEPQHTEHCCRRFGYDQRKVAWISVSLYISAIYKNCSHLNASFRLKFRMATSPPHFSIRGLQKWESLCSNWVRHCYIYRNLWCPVVARYLSCLLPPYRHRIRVADGESEDGDNAAGDVDTLTPRNN